MPRNERVKTDYKGVFYLEVLSRATGKPERIYHIRYRTPDGKMVEERVGSSIRNRMTASKASGIREDRRRGKQLPNREHRRVAREQAARWTIEKLWEEYKDQKGDYPSLRTDKSNFEHIRPLFGKREPRELVQLDVDRLRIKLGKQREPQTVKHVLNLLQRLLRFGERKGLCKGPGFAIEKPRVNSIKTEDLSPEQMQKLLEALDEESDIQVADMMRMALYTGLRRGELFKLHWEDVDFQRGFIHVRDPKGGTDQKIPLNGAVRALLERHPRTGGPFVFPGRGGKQRSEARVAANRIRKAAGLPTGFRPFHGLRHVYASMLASSGEVDLYTLQKLLTHKSPQMTQRYAHLRDEALKRAADLAGSIITEAMKAKDKDAEGQTA